MCSSTYACQQTPAGAPWAWQTQAHGAVRVFMKQKQPDDIVRLFLLLIVDFHGVVVPAIVAIFFAYIVNFNVRITGYRAVSCDIVG